MFILSQIAGAPTAAQVLAAAVAADLKAALQGKARALLLVSGGRSPLPFFAALRGQSLPWERIDVSLVDERAVPPDHADSNAALVAEHLLTGPAAAARWIPLIEAGDHARLADQWTVAEQAATRANAHADLQAADVVVLGMGTDGHTASLFPDSPHWTQAAETQARYVPLQPTQAPHARVGLSLHALTGQKKCYLWTGGPLKMDTLLRVKMLAEDVAQGRGTTQQLFEAGPLALLIAHPHVTLHVFHSTE
jgi:6-phosphogluconolactonase